MCATRPQITLSPQNTVAMDYARALQRWVDRGFPQTQSERVMTAESNVVNYCVITLNNDDD